MERTLSGWGCSFATMLASRGYARSTAMDKLRVLAHLSEWLGQRNLGAPDLNQGAH